MICTNQSPLALSRMIWKMEFPGREGKTAVVVGTLIDDVPDQKVPNGGCVDCPRSSCTHHLQGLEQDPHLQPAGRALSHGL